MASSDDRLNANQNNQGLTRQLLNTTPQTMRSNSPIKPPAMPKPTTDQLQQWNNEAAYYANQGGGGTLAFIKDYARNAGQLGSGLANIAGGTISAPFLLGADYAENTTRSLLGATNPNPNKYRNESYNTVNGGVDKVSDVAKRTGQGLRSLLGWQAATPVNKDTQNTAKDPQAIDSVPMTPKQQAYYDYYRTGSQPTTVEGIRQINTEGIPEFTNVKPNFDEQGNRMADANTLNIIPPLQSRNARGLLEQAAVTPQVPAYNQGTQVSSFEDSTTGGYYQRRKAERANQRTIDKANNANKENWSLNRQAILDNSQLQNNTQAGRVLTSQADTAERINNLDRMLADFRLPQQQRLAALQTRNLLTQGAQQQQRNAVNVVTEEMNDGSKRQRVVVTDPSTGETIGGNTQQVNRSDIPRLAQASGKTEQQVMEELRSLGVDIL